MPELLVQYSTSTAFASGIIRRLCHSPFSHVDIVVPGEGLLGVSGEDKSLNDPGGVRVRPFDPWPYREKPKVARIATTKVDEVIRTAKGQLGKPFDNGALWEFLSDKPQERDWRDASLWFCSELFIWSLETAGHFPYPLVVAKNRVTPADSLLLLNPFMSVANIAEFVAPNVLNSEMPAAPAHTSLSAAPLVAAPPVARF